MTKEYLSIVSNTLEEIMDTWKVYRVGSSQWIEPKYIRLILQSSAGVFDETLGIVLIDRIAVRISRILYNTFSSIPGLDVKVEYYHIGDVLPSIPSTDIYIFVEDVLDYCRRHH